MIESSFEPLMLNGVQYEHEQEEEEEEIYYSIRYSRLILLYAFCAFLLFVIAATFFCEQSNRNLLMTFHFITRIIIFH